jgi:hypothetical protein
VRPVDDEIRSVSAVGKTLFDAQRKKPLCCFGLVADTTDHVEISRLTSYMKESEIWLLACRDAAVW